MKNTVYRGVKYYHIPKELIIKVSGWNGCARGCKFCDLVKNFDLKCTISRTKNGFPICENSNESTVKQIIFMTKEQFLKVKREKYNPYDRT